MKTINVTIEDTLAERKPDGKTWRDIIELGIETAEKRTARKQAKQ